MRCSPQRLSWQTQALQVNRWLSVDPLREESSRQRVMRPVRSAFILPCRQAKPHVSAPSSF